MAHLSTLALALPVLLFSSVIAVDPTKNTATTTSSTSSGHLSSPSTSPSTAALESAKFRDSLRLKLKLVSDAMKYGSTYGTTTESPTNEMEESLTLSSAELGTSSEINVEDAMRSILSSNDVSQPERPSVSNFRRFNAGTKHSDSTNNRRLKAAVRTKHTFEFRPVKIDQLQEEPEPRIIEVEARSLPLEIHFKSASSRIKMVQEHQKGEIREEERVQTEDEPQRLIHLVRKPIIQEVREIITPYRRIVQEIQPVVEEIHTVISHSAQQRHEDEQRLIGADNKLVGLEMEDAKFERQTLKPISRPQTQSKSEVMQNIENYIRAQKPIQRKLIHSSTPATQKVINESEFEQIGNGVKKDTSISPARINQQIQRRHVFAPQKRQISYKNIDIQQHQASSNQNYQSTRPNKHQQSNYDQINQQNYYRNIYDQHYYNKHYHY